MQPFSLALSKTSKWIEWEPSEGGRKDAGMWQEGERELYQ